MKRFAILVPLAICTGCRMVQTAVGVPGQTLRAVTPGNPGQPAVNPVEVQEKMLRFADEFSTRSALAVDKLRRGEDPLRPAEVLQWKIALTSETCSIASGPNAVANLLDMTVFVGLTRMAVEQQWQPNVFGKSADPLLETCRIAEPQIWRLASTVLRPEQQTELRQAIAEAHKRNPVPENPVAVRALGFTDRAAKSNQTGDVNPGSVFSLLNMDPLAGLDPAMREIAQTRLLAERALFLAKKMPGLLRWQTELLAVHTVQLPALQQLVTNSTRFAASVDRFAALAEKWPGQISTEREEILKALESQERTLNALVNEVRQTLTTGTAMSTSLNTTLVTFDALMKRFGVGETNRVAAGKTNAGPFRVQDYGQTAVQLEGMARQLTELIQALDRTLGPTNLAHLSAQVGPVVQQAQAGGKEITDYAFRKGVLFLLIACVSGLATALTYRFLSLRLAPMKRG